MYIKETKQDDCFLIHGSGTGCMRENDQGTKRNGVEEKEPEGEEIHENGREERNGDVSERPSPLCSCLFLFLFMTFLL